MVLQYIVNFIMTKGKKTSIMFVCSLDLSKSGSAEPTKRTYRETPFGTLCLEWLGRERLLQAIHFVEDQDGRWQNGDSEEDFSSVLQRKPLRLGVNATAFQMRVWRSAMKIPAGKTISYGELATKLGQPKACRAVGRALSLNPYALLIPCHRVVPADGSTGEYRWLATRKKALLQAESSGCGIWETLSEEWGRLPQGRQLAGVA